ncbi:CotH kinase family protein [Olivibacter sitiensis]|uniref:CotH kinase family protein n=1 Tax=Olivibacter sitiensis TaxID=376470 RepID=UPI0004123BC2|nr:CotH kinase family protein [Olivibacter sitiensis]
MIRKISCKVFLLVALVSLFSCKRDNHIPEGTEPSLLSFEFKKALNPSLVYDVQTEIIDDTIYAYTLAGTDIANLIPNFEHAGEQVIVNGEIQESENSPQDFRQLVKYIVKAQNDETHTYVVKFEDTGLPAIYVTTAGAQEIANREDYVEGNMKIVRGFQNDILYEGPLEIRGRGNSTWEMPKKPFRVRLKEKAPLLEMPSNRHWALMANYGDKSLIRNDIAFELSRRLELEYTPRQQYADMFLNGEYIGNYNLTEHIREDKDRVNIEESNGGFILEADGYAYAEPVYFITPKEMPITVKFPDEDDITPEQLDYITTYFTTFENSLFSESFSDPEIGYQQYFDMETFVNYYLVNEICGNPDMFWSTRMYKKSTDDPKIYTGPVWDFDLAFNNDSRLNDAVRTLMLTDAHEPKTWMRRFAQDANFKKAVRDRWNASKANAIDNINEYIDLQAKRLQRSQALNFKKWNILQNPDIHLNWYVGSTYQDYIEFIKTYFNTRIAWLDETINGAQFD